MASLGFPLVRRMTYCLMLLWIAGLAAPGWGQFETRSTQALPGEAFAPATGDFNHDGKLDIAVISGGSLVIMLGNGDGTFRTGASYPLPLAYAIAVADFNRDGNLDIVVANENLNPSTVSVFLGNGDGTFQTPIDSDTTSYNEFVAVGDFNGDGKMDIAVIDNPYISVLLGNGDGTFQPPTDNNSFVGAAALALGDFNNDHKLDVAVVGSFGGSQNIGILLGNGDGSLQPALIYPLAYTPQSVAAGDFNGDGNLDVAIGGYIGDDTTVFLGNGDGTFQQAQVYSGGSGPIIVGDFNLDGKLDLVTGAFSGIGVAEFLGNGDGTFQPAQVFASNYGGLEAAGDLNGDHRLDLVLLGNIPLSVTTMLNTGAVRFSPSSPQEFPSQLIGTTSHPQQVQLTNTGAVPVSITSIKASTSFRTTTTCGNAIAVGASCSVSAVFQPVSGGTKTGLITIVDSASTKPQFIELNGFPTVVKVLPGSLSFGTQKAGSTSKPLAVTATNEGSTSIIYKSLSIGGADRRDFSIENNTCIGTSVPPGGACSVSVTFSPKKMGSRTGTLGLTLQMGGDNPAPVMLTGTGD